VIKGPGVKEETKNVVEWTFSEKYLPLFKWNNFLVDESKISIIVKTAVPMKCRNCLFKGQYPCTHKVVLCKIYLEHGDVCAICLESLCDRKLEKLHCGHVFHSECIKVQIEYSGKCALCRK
jgi:hypothetical protein